MVENSKDFIYKITIILQVKDDPKTYKETIISRDSSCLEESISVMVH